MMKSRALIRTITLGAGAFLLLTAQAGAGPVRSFSELKARVRADETLHVFATSGREFTGSLVEVTDSRIVLIVQGARQEVEEAAVRRVETDRDPVWDGTIKGAGIGFGLGLINCRGASCVAGPLFFAGIGTLVDLLKKGRTRVYEAPAVP